MSPSAADVTPAPPDALLAAVAELVCARTGLTFTDTSRDRLATALGAALLREPEPGGLAFLARLQSDPGRVEALAAATTIAESYFFRDSAQFDWLRREGLPALYARDTAEPLRVWCAGCANGEEPYSIAILLRETGYRGPATIVGSDLSGSSLANARKADYSRWALRSVPPETVARWFHQDGDRFALDTGVRDAVKFVAHNLAADSYPPPHCGFAFADLIICRNVLIYFDRPTVARVTERLLEALCPHGWLVLGASDPPIADLVPCEVVVTDAGLIYRHAGAREQDSRVIDLRAAHASADATEQSPDWSWARYAPAPATGETLGDGVMAVESPTEPAFAGLLRTRYAKQDYRGAVAVAERILRAEPGSEIAWITLVRSLGNLGDLQQAGRANALAVERCPLSAELSYLTGLLQTAGGHHVEAVAAARRALYLDHTLAVAHMALGAALAQIGDSDGAIRSFDNAEHLLTGMRPEHTVAAGDGETAGAMIALLRTQRRLLARRDDAH